MSSIDDNTKIKINNHQKELINSYLDENGRLSCINAFIVAKKGAMEIKDMSSITKSLGIRINDCELGVFGKIDFLPKDEAIYESIVNKYESKKLDCKVYWDEAKVTNLHKVGSTVKHSDLEVKNCQLGCFRLKEGKKKRG